MEIKHLVTFKEVARTLSFSRAAESLNYSQSTVTAQIQSLEQELDTQLFNRLSRGISMTPMGEKLLFYANQIVNLEAEARISIRQATQYHEGSITLDGDDAFLFFRLPSILREFSHRYPSIEIVVNTRYVHERVNLEELVRTGIIDYAFRITDKISKDLSHELLFYTPGELIAAPHHPLADKSSVSIQDLDDEVIFFITPDCPYRRFLGESLGRFDSRAIHNVTLRNIHAIKQQVMLGKGISFLARLGVQNELDRGDLISLKPDWMQSPKMAVSLVWNTNQWRSPALEAFHEVVRECCSQAIPSPDKLESINVVVD